MIEITFNHHQTSNFEEALSYAKKAEIFIEYEEFKKIKYRCSFILNELQISACIKLCKLAYPWRDFEIQADGKNIRNYFALSNTLECYRNSTYCADYKAHCWRIKTFSHPEKNALLRTKLAQSLSGGGIAISITAEEILGQLSNTEKYKNIDLLLPCRYIDFPNTFIDANLTLHPSSIIDRINAKAIENVVFMCPCFKNKSWELELNSLFIE